MFVLVGVNINLVGHVSFIAKVDKKGGILLQKETRENVGIKEESNARIRIESEKKAIEPLESIADKFFGVFSSDRWPKDLDNFILEVIKNWKISSST